MKNSEPYKEEPLIFSPTTGSELRDWRKILGMTQERCAKKLKYNKYSISRIERENRLLSAEMIGNICDYQEKERNKIAEQCEHLNKYVNRDAIFEGLKGLDHGRKNNIENAIIFLTEVDDNMENKNEYVKMLEDVLTALRKIKQIKNREGDYYLKKLEMNEVLDQLNTYLKEYIKCKPSK